MCEQTGVTYLDGDVVWVKLGNCWWPGEVQDQEKLSEEIRSDFKKPPIAVVKFFQEDSYEYVWNINHIYKYSCRRKNEFIRKGLDMHRANKAYMDRFPADICHAETLIGGDPDIITRDDFIPDKRPSYSDIFRTPTPKKSKTGTGRGRQSLGATPKSGSSGSSGRSRITHPRFTGNNDYGVTIMIQTTPPPKTSQYSCHVCSYETTNLYVMMRHNQTHIDGSYVSPSQNKNKTSPKKMKSAKYFATTNSIDEDLALIRQGVIVTTDGSSDSDEDLPPKPKVKSPPKSTIKRKNNKESNSASKKAKISKVFNNILADWGDENSSDETESAENTNLINKKNNTVNAESAASEKVDDESLSKKPEDKLETEVRSETKGRSETEGTPETEGRPATEDDTPEGVVVEEEKKAEEKTPEKVSCFDFDDEDTDDTILEKSPGRKIPRVIPPKRISKDTLEEELDKLIDESAKPITEEQTANKQLNENEETEPDMEAFKNILEETTIPELPPIPDILEKNSALKKLVESKTDKNTIDSRNLIEHKTDDSAADKSNGVLKKSETKEPEVSITQAPKKRMVRNFEEFENLMHDQPEESAESSPQPKSNLEVSKLKFQVMKKLNDSPTKKQSTSEKEQSSTVETKAVVANKFFRRRTRHSLSDSEKSESSQRRRKPHITSPKQSDSEDVSKVEIEPDSEKSESCRRKRKPYITSSKKSESEDVDKPAAEPVSEKSESNRRKQKPYIPSSKNFESEALDKTEAESDSEKSESSRRKSKTYLASLSEFEDVNKPAVEPVSEKSESNRRKLKPYIPSSKKIESEALDKTEAELDSEKSENSRRQRKPYIPSLKKSESEDVNKIEAEPDSEKFESSRRKRKQHIASSKKFESKGVDKMEAESDRLKSENSRRKRKSYINITSPKKSESEDVDKIETYFENIASEEKKFEVKETIGTGIQTFLDKPKKEVRELVLEDDKTEITANLVEETTKTSLLMQIEETTIPELPSILDQNTIASKKLIVEIPELKNDLVEPESTIHLDIPTITEEQNMQISTQSPDSKNYSDKNFAENFPEDAFLEEKFPIPKIDEPPERDPPSDNVSESSRSQKLLADISDICIDNSDHLSGLSTLAAVSELSGNLKPITEDSEIQSVEETARGTTPVQDETIVESYPPTIIEDIEEAARGGTPVQDEPVEEIVSMKPKTLANFSLDFSDSNSESTTIIKKLDNDEHIVATVSKEDPESIVKMENKQDRIVEDFEAIDCEIEKITLRETAADKLHSFREDLSNNSQDDMDIETSYPEFSIPETILEKSSSNFQAKNSEIVMNTEMSLESEIAKLTDTEPGTESILQEQQQNTSSSKLLEILTDTPSKKETMVRSILSPSGVTQQKIQMVIKESKASHLKKFDPKSKFIIKSSTYKPVKSAKPIILSEKIIRPMAESENVSVKKVTSKRSLQDVEDIDTFIIQKPNKKPTSESMDQHDIILTPKLEATKNLKTISVRSRVKPKIIEQTIIKPADVQPVTIQSTDNQQSLLDDSMFDINSMPIVLSDQILTPESIENMPVVMSNMLPSVSTSSSITHTEKNTTALHAKKTGTIKLINKDKTITSQSTTSQADLPKTQTIVKNIIPRTLGKNQKIFQATSKMLKQNTAVITQPGKPGKFLVIPTSNSPPSSGSKYTVGKRPMKNLQQISPTTSKLKPIQQNLTSEPTGNKIMIITNERGVQSRVLLTPAQQKLLGCKMPTKITKSPQVKSVVQKSILTSKGTIISPINSKTSALASQTIVTSKGQMFTTQQGGLVTSEGQILTQLKGKPDMKGKKIQFQPSKMMLSDLNKSGDSLQKVNKANILQKTKTILIKGSQGQAIKKIQTSIPESKNVLISPSSQKQQHLMSLASQHMQVTGKQVVVTSKGQLIKADSKFISKSTADKLRMQKSSATPTRIVSKSNKSQITYSSTPKQLSSPVVPPLAPITVSQKKDISKQIIKHSSKVSTSIVETPTTSSTKQPNQLVIQDPQGNQTTVTEGQILALPSGETVDGQPQSYVLVTVDESGNLVPISNDTLMSLDPNLAMGGDMNNIVIQIDPGNQEGGQEGKFSETTVVHSSNTTQQLEQAHTTLETMDQSQPQEQQLISADDQLMITNQTIPASIISETMATTEKSIVETHPERFVTEETHMVTTDDVNLLQETQQTTAVTCNINNGDSSQQLIITGDPESTQKFLDSLTGGNTDLSSLLSGADGNIIINADGQQILLNTDPDNQILLSVNSDNLGLIPGTSGGDSTPFVTHSVKNQDILAAALADTDVFQQDIVDKTISSQSLTKVVSSSSASQLSPNSSLYPMNVGNILETSLTLGSPIMTPLEVPSINNRKISEVETTLQVPSSLELPITITDPSISQTVSQQVMLGNDLQTNLELPITMSESEITSIRSSGINSPSFIYSLPSLDESSGLEHKRYTETSTVMSADVYNTSLTGSMSMPLLTEEPEINTVEPESISMEAQITLEADIGSIKPEVNSVEAEIASVEPNDNFVVPEIVPETSRLVPEIISVGPEASSLLPEIDSDVPEATSVVPEIDSDVPEARSIGPEIAAMEYDSVGQTKLVSECETASMQPEIVSVEPEIASVEPEIASMEQEIVAMEPEIASMEPESTSMEPESASMEPESASMEPGIPSVDSEITTVEPEITTTPEITTVEPEITTVDPEITTVEPEITTVESEIATVKSEITRVESELTSVESEILSVECGIPSVESEIPSVESEIPSVESEIPTVESEIPSFRHEMEPEFTCVETKTPSPEAEMSAVGSEIESVKADITSASEIPIVQTQVSSVEAETLSSQSEVALEDPELTSTTPHGEISAVATEKMKDDVPVLCTESEQIQNLNFSSDSLTTPEKLDAELQIGPIEDDLDLNHSVICSSLSEPPPGMFDKSFSSLLNRDDDDDDDVDDDDDDDDDSPAEEGFGRIDAHAICTLPESAVNEASTEDQRHTDLLSSSENVNFEVDMMQAEVTRPALSATPISDLNSPRMDIDENSSEIPIQPQIVASLSGSGFDDNISDEEEESNSHGARRKRSNEEFDESDVKRTKVSCD